MNFQKAVLILYIIGFFGFSIPAFFFPTWFADALGYELTEPGAKMEFMAAYGGLILGVGIFLIYCAKNAVRTGLVAVLMIMGMLFAGRVIGYVIEQETNAVQNAFLFIELLTIILVSIALKHRRSTA